MKATEGNNITIWLTYFARVFWSGSFSRVALYGILPEVFTDGSHWRKNSAGKSLKSRSQKVQPIEQSWSKPRILLSNKWQKANWRREKDTFWYILVFAFYLNLSCIKWDLTQLITTRNPLPMGFLCSLKSALVFQCFRPDIWRITKGMPIAAMQCIRW